jgi:hypothetical protein
MALFGLFAQAQSTEAPVAPPPEVLKALADLVKATADHLPANRWLTPDGLKAAASLIGAVAWPMVVLILALIYSPQLKEVIGGLTELEFLGVKAKIAKKIKNQLDRSAEAAKHLKGLSQAPTPGELDV